MVAKPFFLPFLHCLLAVCLLFGGPAWGLILRLDGSMEIHERLVKFTNQELHVMLSSVVPTPRSLRTLSVILADPNHNWRPIYGNFCRQWTWDQFMQVLHFSQLLPGGIPKSPLLCRECVRWVQVAHPRTRKVLRRHQSPQGIPEEASFDIYDSDLVEIFHHAPGGGPLPFRDWCRHGGYLGEGIDLAIYNHMDLPRHLTRVCFLPNNPYLPSLQPLLIAQVATASPSSINRLLLSMPLVTLRQMQLDLAAALHRRLCLPGS